MKKCIAFSILFISTLSLLAQDVMTPEKLWELGRVSPVGITNDGNSVVYRVTTPSITTNDFSSKTYMVSLSGGDPKEIEDHSTLVTDKTFRQMANTLYITRP